MIRALVPGSFDPLTMGHLDIIERCSGIFDEVLVAVVENPYKQGLFTVTERCELIGECIAGWTNVSADSFSGLLVDFAAKCDVSVIVKGLRAMTDFDYEMQMSQMNRCLSGIETLFISTKPEYGYLSSSLVKQVASLGGDVGTLVPGSVLAALKEKYASS